MAMYMTVKDAWNVPVDSGLKCKRYNSGKVRMYYDANGKLVEAYSYNACILAMMPDGRYVVNITNYGNTTSRHQRDIFSAAGYKWYEGTPICEALNQGFQAKASDLVRFVMARGYQLAG